MRRYSASLRFFICVDRLLQCCSTITVLLYHNAIVRPLQCCETIETVTALKIASTLKFSCENGCDFWESSLVGRVRRCFLMCLNCHQTCYIYLISVHFYCYTCYYADLYFKRGTYLSHMFFLLRLW